MHDTSLFEFAGGEAALLRLARAHHQRCLDDPVLNHPFSHPDQHPEHVERLAMYWAEVLGGPPKYTELCQGTESGLQRMHAGNHMQADMAERFVACFVGAADDAGLPADAKFRAALRAYMEWAVGAVFRYNDVDPAGVPDGLAVPRWSWDGLVRA